MEEPQSGEHKPEDEECGQEPWEGSDYVDGDVARAMAHPLRVQILGVLNKRMMSPSRFAKEYDEKLSNTSYHFRTLQKLGCIEEVETRPARGAVEHFYRATKRALFDGKAWNDLPQSLKANVTGKTTGDFLAAVTASMEAEVFDARDERMLVWVQKRLDQQGWEEAVEAHRDLVRTMLKIFKDASRRLTEAGEPGGGMLGTYAVFLFESPEPPSEHLEEEE